jgi:competence protein ComEC
VRTLFHRPGLTPLSAGVVFAATLHVQQLRLPQSAWALIHLALAMCVSILLWRWLGRPSPKQAAVGNAIGAWVLACFCAGWLAWSWMNVHAVWRHPQVPTTDWEGPTLRLQGVVSELPQQHEDSWRFHFDVEAAWREDTGLPLEVPQRILLGWYGRGTALDTGLPERLRAGERWALSVRLKQVHGQMNPGGFDFERWAWEQGLGATGTVRNGPNDRVASRLAMTSRHLWAQWRQSMRDRIHERVSEPRWAHILAGLVVGDATGIERSDWDVFRATGIAHLMSISGLHVTLLAWWLRALVIFLWRRTDVFGASWSLWLPAPWAGLCVGLAAAWAYALFSGWGLPAQRTVWMLTLTSMLQFSGRRWPTPLVWGGVFAAVLLFDPLALLQPGFWLSYVAVAVLFAGGTETSPQTSPLSGPSAKGLQQALRRWWREQALMTVTLSPLCALFFQQVSLVGLVANALAIPWVTFWVTPLALLGMGLPWLWDWSAASLALLMALMTPLAAWPWATWSSASPPWALGALALLGALLLALPGPLQWRLWGLPMLLPCFFWQAERPAQGVFEILAADVGQGNAVVVRTARHALLYDAGPRYSRETDAGQRVVVPLLRHGNERLDALVLSHQDSDHTGGALSVWAMQPQAQVWRGIPQGHALAALGNSRACLRGEHWEWDGVLFEFLHPLQADYATQRKPNALSCVLKISAQGRVALLVADIELPQEKRLLSQGADALKADLLLVPHHGSLTSSSPPFVQAVRPKWAWVQAGYRNRFGHPAPAVQARYEAEQAQWVTTAHCGAASWRSDAPDDMRCERTQRQRYWHHVMAPIP